MSSPEQFPEGGESTHQLWLDNLRVEATELRARFEYNRKHTEDVMHSTEKYISERLLTGQPFTEQEHALCRDIGLFCRMMGIEVPIFIDLNYVSGNQE